MISHDAIATGWLVESCFLARHPAIPLNIFDCRPQFKILAHCYFIKIAIEVYPVEPLLIRVAAIGLSYA